MDPRGRADGVGTAHPVANGVSPPHRRPAAAQFINNLWQASCHADTGALRPGTSRSSSTAIAAFTARAGTRSLRTPAVLPRLVTVAYLLYLILPMALLLLGSFGQSWMNTILPTGLTGRWYAEVLADPSFRRAFSTSLVVAAATCVACLAIGLPLVQAIRRARSPWLRSLARVLALMPVALPPLVLAFGYVRAFSSETLPWLGSSPILIAGHVVLAVPYFVQTVLADSERLGLRRLEEAAESLGAGQWQRYRQVVLPALGHSILAALIIVVALSIGEFQFSNLVAGFLGRTYPIVLLQAFYGATGFACAATVVLLVLALFASVASALAGWLASPTPAGHHG